MEFELGYHHRGRFESGRFQGEARLHPHRGGPLSGDRYGVRAVDGALLFYVADAAGHGERGHAVWREHGPSFEDAWRDLAHGPCGLAELRGFGRRINALLQPDDSICLAAGLLEESGLLRFANFGYGVHVLPSGGRGAWWHEDPLGLFGLKLGWLDPVAWEDTRRAFIAHEVWDVDRIMVLTDGFFDEDHADVDETLSEIRRLGASCARLALDEAVARVAARPHSHDDATLLAIERTNSGRC